MTKEQMEFTVFCIESYADKFGLDGKDVYNAFSSNGNIINNFIIKNFDVLHTQSKEIIIDDLHNVVEIEGIKI